MEALRFTYLKLRLGTFRLAFGVSTAGFLISLVSLAVACFYGERLTLRRKTPAQPSLSASAFLTASTAA